MRHLLRRFVLAAGIASLLVGSAIAQGAPRPPWLDPYRDAVAQLIAAAASDDFAWRRLAEMTDTFGARLSGSDNLERSIVWAADMMRRDGFQNVHLEPVMVPRWVRGRERADIVDPPQHELSILGLGGSVSTPPEGLEGEVLLVDSFEELRRRGADARGRIVLFNAPFISYNETVTYRTTGARTASQYGAIAVLVRSIGPAGLRTPHTGSVDYGESTVRIPAAAVAVEDVERIQRLIASGQRVRVRLTLESRTEPDVQSYNVVGEIRGRQHPDEVVLLGSHIDSWDVGTGASDNAVGCVVTWEAARLMLKLGLRPRRTVRVVLFTNEENGLRGADAYLQRYRAHAANHVFALESDSGVFQPASLGFTGTPAARAVMRDITSLLLPLNVGEMVAGGGGADVGPIVQAASAPSVAYLGNPTRYFAIHHTAADTIERIAPDDVAKAVATIATLSYVVAEMPDRLPTR